VWSRPRLRELPYTQAGAFALWSTPAGFSACHAHADLSQCTQELERAAVTAVAVWNAFVGVGCAPRWTGQIQHGDLHSQQAAGSGTQASGFGPRLAYENK
jgi:hypothetical protein